MNDQMRRTMRGAYALPKPSSASRCEPTPALVGRRVRSSSSISTCSTVVMLFSRHQRYIGFRPHLQIVERPIAAIARQQLQMRATLEHNAILDEEDLVGMHERTQPVRDDDRHAVRCKFAHREADTLLGRR